jgi:hypothetical protein
LKPAGQDLHAVAALEPTDFTLFCSKKETTRIKESLISKNTETILFKKRLTSENKPLLQVVQCDTELDAAVVEYRPVAQAMQSNSLSRASKLLHFPVAHALQYVVPKVAVPTASKSENLPATQGLQPNARVVA